MATAIVEPPGNVSQPENVGQSGNVSQPGKQDLIGLVNRNDVMKALRDRRESFVPFIKDFAGWILGNQFLWGSTPELVSRFNGMCDRFELERIIISFEPNTNWQGIEGSFQRRFVHLLEAWGHMSMGYAVGQYCLMIYTVMELCGEIGI
jgi:hypothetical protein